MKQLVRLLGVALFGLAVGACDKCGGWALGVWSADAPMTCSAPAKPQG